MNFRSILSITLILFGTQSVAQPSPTPRVDPRASVGLASQTSPAGETGSGTTYTCCGKESGCNSQHICKIAIVTGTSCSKLTGGTWNVVSNIKTCLAAIDSDYNWSKPVTWNQTNGATWSFNTPKTVPCPTGTSTTCNYCCNSKTGNVVPASANGCNHGQALYPVFSPEDCTKGCGGSNGSCRGNGN